VASSADFVSAFAEAVPKDIEAASNAGSIRIWASLDSIARSKFLVEAIWLQARREAAVHRDIEGRRADSIECVDSIEKEIKNAVAESKIRNLAVDVATVDHDARVALECAAGYRRELHGNDWPFESHSGDHTNGNKANQSPEPTSPPVTPPAGQEPRQA